MNRLLILGWHNVAPTPSFPFKDSADSAQGFIRQALALSRWMTPVSLPETLEALRAGRRIPQRAVALTFDDGYRDNATIVAPILHALGIPATFFLVPGFLDGQVDPWWETLAQVWATVPPDGGSLAGWTVPMVGGTRRRALAQAQSELKALCAADRTQRINEALDVAGITRAAATAGLMMDWDDARSLRAAGFTIGSHTMSHPILAREDTQTQRRELIDAAAALRSELGCDIPLVAYPNGSAHDVNADSASAARAAGHDFGITTVWGLNGPSTDPFLIRRVLLQPTRTLRTLRWDCRARPWTRP